MIYRQQGEIVGQNGGDPVTVRRVFEGGEGGTLLACWKHWL